MPEKNRPWLRTIPLLNSESGKAIVRKSCEAHGFSLEDFYDLMESEVEKVRGERRKSLFESFDEIFNETTSNVD